MTPRRPLLAETLEAVREYFVVTMRHPLGFLGACLTTLAGLLLLGFVALGLAGHPGNPYLGIITFLILPLIFLLGLALMPLGHYRMGKRAAQDGESAPQIFPRIDLNEPRTRNRFVLFLGVTLLNLVIFTVAVARAIEFMDSVEFCGQVCHEVMHPELTAYRGSPHARVRCVDCHIGPGASWFVRSKLSGTRQVFAAILRTYPRPIPTPVENLRPARETCEQCHWPQKFHGEKLVVKTHYRDDEANTAVQTVLALKVGGGTHVPEGDPSIHWHVNNQVDYISDEDRETVYWVRAVHEDGSAREFFRPGVIEDGVDPKVANLPDSLRARPVRRMDCVDCHNRPTHIYEPATAALDQAMSLGTVPSDLPYFRREALAALEGSYATTEEALESIERQLMGFYQTEYPDLVEERAGALAGAVQAIQAIYADNVFPHMNIGWGTYPDHIGHQYSTGCFRCHDDEMATAEAETISQDCTTCHTLLAVEEENPPILDELFPEE